ncbi:hypothetical protein QZH46_01675 [Pseudomonas corrugata]
MESRVVKLETHVEYIRHELNGMGVDLREHRTETRLDFRVLFAVDRGLTGTGRDDGQGVWLVMNESP